MGLRENHLAGELTNHGFRRLSFVGSMPKTCSRPLLVYSCPQIFCCHLGYLRQFVPAHGRKHHPNPDHIHSFFLSRSPRPRYPLVKTTSSPDYILRIRLRFYRQGYGSQHFNRIFLTDLENNRHPPDYTSKSGRAIKTDRHAHFNFVCPNGSGILVHIIPILSRLCAQFDYDGSSSSSWSSCLGNI